MPPKHQLFALSDWRKKVGGGGKGGDVFWLLLEVEFFPTLYTPFAPKHLSKRLTVLLPFASGFLLITCRIFSTLLLNFLPCLSLLSISICAAKDYFSLTCIRAQKGSLGG